MMGNLVDDDPKIFFGKAVDRREKRFNAVNVLKPGIRCRLNESVFPAERSRVIHDFIHNIEHFRSLVSLSQIDREIKISTNLLAKSLKCAVP